MHGALTHNDIYMYHPTVCVWHVTLSHPTSHLIIEHLVWDAASIPVVYRILPTAMIMIQLKRARAHIHVCGYNHDTL